MTMSARAARGSASAEPDGICTLAKLPDDEESRRCAGSSEGATKESNLTPDGYAKGTAVRRWRERAWTRDESEDDPGDPNDPADDACWGAPAADAEAADAAEGRAHCEVSW